MKDDDRGPTFRDGAEDGPVDLSTLFGDRASTGQWEALARRIEAAAAPELSRRAARAGRWAGTGGGLVEGIAGAVARVAGPALVAAAAAILIAVGATRSSGESATLEASVDVVASAESLSEETVRQALGADPGTWSPDSSEMGTAAALRAMYDADGDQE